MHILLELEANEKSKVTTKGVIDLIKEGEEEGGIEFIELLIKGGRGALNFMKSFTFLLLIKLVGYILD